MMSVFDRNSWTDNKNFGVDEIKLIGEHFKTPLKFNNYSEPKALLVWIALRKYAERVMPKVATDVMWAQLVTHHCELYRNILLLVEIMLVLSPSNSVVERGFSTLRNILSDKRLSTRIRINSQIFSKDVGCSEQSDSFTLCYRA